MGFWEFVLGFAAGMNANRTRTIYITDNARTIDNGEESVDELNMPGTEG